MTVLGTVTNAQIGGKAAASRTLPSSHIRACVPGQVELGTDAPPLLASESVGEPAPCPRRGRWLLPAGLSLGCLLASRQCAEQVLILS